MTDVKVLKRLLTEVVYTIRIAMANGRDSFIEEHPEDAVLLREFYDHLHASVINAFEAKARNT